MDEKRAITNNPEKRIFNRFAFGIIPNTEICSLKTIKRINQDKRKAMKSPIIQQN